MAGQPPLWASVDELQEKIDEYFNYCDENGKPYTISGLAYYLGTSRQTLCNYREKDEFFDSISRAKRKCEMFAEEKLFRDKGSPQGIMFNLTNNYGWESRTVNENHNYNVNEEDVKKLNEVFGDDSADQKDD